MRRRTFIAGGLLLLLGPRPSPAAAQESRLILALGNAGFLDPGAILAATGARVVHETGDRTLDDFAVVVLADVAYAALPPRVRAGVVAYVNAGGALLITGGPDSWGAGGYQPLAPILPFKLLGHQDWGAVPFREPVPIQPGHPILAGVEFIPVGTVNWVEVAQGANEILRLAGGPHNYPFSLIAEKGSGAGDVLGMTFDPNQLRGQASLDRFVRNVIAYLLAVSQVS
jgi:uncharacterized membrane protein